MRQSSPAVQEARAAIAARLYQVRRGAGLTGIALANRTGLHRTKISKIEHGVQMPTAADIRIWCESCGAPDETPELVASLETIEEMWVEFRRLELTGLSRINEQWNELFERARQIQVYEANIIPGLVHAFGYAAGVLQGTAFFRGIPDDSAEAAKLRVKHRSRLLRSGKRAIRILMEQPVLQLRFCDDQAMTEQLAHLITVSSMSNIELGIIPLGVERTVLGYSGFWIFDEDRVMVETFSAQLTITQPREVALYLRAFDLLSSMAVNGATARRLIAEAIAALDH